MIKMLSMAVEYHTFLKILQYLRANAAKNHKNQQKLESWGSSDFTVTELF